jgi:hypothetical protein
MKKLALALLLVGSACTPQLSTPVEEIPKLTKLDDVMANQATVMDPLFKKIGQTSFNDDEWALLTSAGTRVQATSLKIKDFTKGAEFDALAMKLNRYAADLSNSYASKDAVAANTALTNMRATCKECHKRFR